MEVKLIEATENPEELVCRAARNDYLSDGVIKPINYDGEEVVRNNEKVVVNRDFEEIMEAITPKNEHVRDAGEHFYMYPSKYLDFDSSDLTDEEKWEKVSHDDVEDYVFIEAKKRYLIDELIDSGHWGPFEHPQATIALNGVTRVLMAQITRHRHFTFDIMSLRYVELDDVNPKKPPQDRGDISKRFQFPEFRGEDFDVDRDGVHEIANVEAVQTQYASAYLKAVDHYQNLLGLGVPQEQARKVLPMGTKVNIVMSANARAWMHILNVRTKANVQGETRRAAEAILDEMQDWMPYTMKKYKEDVLPLKLNP